MSDFSMLNQQLVKETMILYNVCFICFLIVTDFKFLLAEFYSDEHHRVRRQANSGSNTSKAKRTAPMLKKFTKFYHKGDRD